LVIVLWVAVATLVLPAAARSLPPRASDAVPTAQDVPGASLRGESPAAWIARLPRALRTSVRGAALQQLVTAHAPTRSVLARAVVFSSSSSAAQAVAVFRKRRSMKDDATALGMPAKALKGAATIFWRQGLLVAELIYAGSTPPAGAKVASAFVALLRSRVVARDAETVWSNILATAAAQRIVTKRTALQAFAVAVAPLPGVKRPSGPIGLIGSGDDALDWALYYYRQLTPAQQRVIRAALELPGKHSTTKARRLPAGSSEPNDTPITIGPTADVPAWSKRANDLAAAFGKKFGFPPTFRAYVFRAALKTGVLGRSIGRDDQFSGAGMPTTCDIYVNSAYGEPAEEVLAHEVFHCWQMQLVGGYNAFQVVHTTRQDTWLTDGGANWAACDITRGVAPEMRAYFKDYAEAPFADEPVGLFGMSYEAIGFFSQLERQGLDPYKTTGAALKEESSGEAFKALVGVGEAAEPFYDDWASSFAQSDDRSQPWTMAGTCYRRDSTQVRPTPLPINELSKELLDTGKLQPELWSLDPAPGNYQVQISVSSGRVRISAGKIDDVIVPDKPKSYCLRDLQGDHTPLVALTGDLVGGSATIRGIRGACAPTVTRATFKVDNAQWTINNGSGIWQVNVNWDITWAGDAEPSTLALKKGNTWTAGRASIGGAGTYTYTDPSAPSQKCTGLLNLADAADSPFDSKVTVVEESSTHDSWALLFQVAPDGQGYSVESSCRPPPFGETDLPDDGHRFEALVPLRASSSGGRQTPPPITVSPEGAGENWSGTVTLEGEW
jgi:hypothetical protein